MMDTLAAMKQALEALLSWTPTFRIAIDRRDDAITNLRAAIEQMEKAEPVAWHLIGNQDVFMAAEFEPDAEHLDEWEPLYTAPAVPEGPTFEESKGNCLRAAHGGID